METVLKFRPSWYIFADGSIGIFMLDGDRFAIGSGESVINVTAIDYDLTILNDAICIGSVDILPTIDDAIVQAKVIKKNVDEFLKNIQI